MFKQHRRRHNFTNAHFNAAALAAPQNEGHYFDATKCTAASPMISADRNAGPLAAKKISFKAVRNSPPRINNQSGVTARVNSPVK